MAAIPAAAAVRGNTAGVSDQNSGNAEKIPAAARQRNPSLSTKVPEKAVPISPKTASDTAEQMWSRRSPLRSERAPQSTIETPATANGNAERSPVVRCEVPNPEMICGKKKLRP